MKTLFIWTFFVLTLFVQSCITQQKCQERYPTATHDSIVRKDSVSFVRDTLRIKGDHILVRDTLPCPNANYYHSERHNGLTNTITIKNGVIASDCKEDSLERVIEIQRHDISYYQNKTQTPPPVIEYKTRWYDVPCRWMAGILLALIIFKILKLYFKF